MNKDLAKELRNIASKQNGVTNKADEIIEQAIAEAHKGKLTLDIILLKDTFNNCEINVLKRILVEGGFDIHVGSSSNGPEPSGDKLVLSWC